MLMEWVWEQCCLKGGIRITDIMRTVDSYNLTGLLQDDCWELFREEHLGCMEAEVPNLVTIGREIVKKCGGFNRKETEWLSKLRDHGNLLEDGTGILPVLKLSYVHL
uniref:NB-ARC domain-containing protein n=1 Tax=Nelumbo nucifera TaxID=4432 RepID=A0A822ZDX0_NELNU|nr:TPA_asm: hypothetical protein HUJ06_000930 [Nelumbo nucifera]